MKMKINDTQVMSIVKNILSLSLCVCFLVACMKELQQKFELHYMHNP